ncbi:MAG TPA: gephyrin-like molybdotransferase Glp [Thermodesulfovibrionia bacterium]|nr:gephyrin-like molybdotransferase Glp [Thermodesulfovibrionia bacterium]
MKTMLLLDEAIQHILDRIKPLQEETVTLDHAHARVMSRDVISDADIPLFDNSSMDGYALRSDDVKGASEQSPVTLTVVEHIRAGSVPQVKLEPFQASRIFTGAQVPLGADAVVIQENTRRGDSAVEILEPVGKGANIRRIGEDMKTGAVCVSAGKLITAADMGLMAAVGKETVYVHRRPIVAVLTTGDELIEPGKPLEPGKIRNSNTYSLIGQVLQYGGLPINLGVARDDPEDIQEKLTTGLKSADMLITSGGVSVGDHDEVQAVFSTLGVELVFWKVRMKPGKPLLFGMYQDIAVFGVPGNVASSMVVFEQILRPALLKMCGRKALFLPEIEAELMDDLRCKGDRVTFIRVTLQRTADRFHAFSSGSQSSGVLSSFASAHGFVSIPIGQKLLAKGQRIKVQVIDWSFLS